MHSVAELVVCYGEVDMLVGMLNDFMMIIVGLVYVREIWKKAFRNKGQELGFILNGQRSLRLNC